MKTSQVIGLSAVALLIYTLFTKSKALSETIFSPYGIKNWGWQGITPYLTFEVSAQNTSNQQININSVAGNVYYDNNGSEMLIGNLSSFTPQVIAPNSQSVLEITATLQPLQAINVLFKILSQGLTQLGVRISGSANVQNYQVPVNLNF